MSTLEQTAIGVSVLAIVVMFVVIIAACVVINSYDKELANARAVLDRCLAINRDAFSKFTKLSKAHAGLITSHATLQRAYKAAQQELARRSEDHSTRPLDADPPA